jgi:hypothetical protein
MAQSVQTYSVSIREHIFSVCLIQEHGLGHAVLCHIFLNPNRISTRESHEYDQILNHIHWLTNHPDSPIWAKSRPTSSHTDNKLVAEVLERSWALIFTGQGPPQLQ